jgi:hypothetical protein
VIWNLGLLVEAPDPCIHIITRKRERTKQRTRKKMTEREQNKDNRGIRGIREGKERGKRGNNVRR